MSKPYFQRGRRFSRDMTRVNERIRAPRVRVIDGTSGTQLGVLPTQEAIRKAKSMGLDLVEIAANADPPVCKIVDYGKYKYEQSKQKKDKNKSKSSKIKEVKFRVRIDPHDYRIKMEHAEDFLAHGYKLKVQLQFRGREMAHQEIGMELMHKVKEDLKTMAHVDMEPRKAGRNISMMLSPLAPHLRKRKFKVLSPVETEGPPDDEDDHDHDDEDDDEDDHDDDADDAADEHAEAEADDDGGGERARS